MGIFPNRGENKKYSQPPPSYGINVGKYTVRPLDPSDPWHPYCDPDLTKPDSGFQILPVKFMEKHVVKHHGNATPSFSQGEL